MSELIVYNLRKEKFSHSLNASGVANRWNKNEEYIIYTASSRALSVLELSVHRAYIKIDESYKFLVVKLSVFSSDLEEIQVNELSENWQSITNYPALQKLGSVWYRAMDKLVLKVPSALVPKEFNYLINTKHPDFEKKVKLVEIEDFNWDDRLI